MLGAPGSGGDLIGCEGIPRLSSTPEAGGGHALRTSLLSVDDYFPALSLPGAMLAAGRVMVHDCWLLRVGILL
ncbi:hypothetical protein Nepgr_017453 [Nepenthes gracilis]|uniref:Uncharacterized protein n=1 Tax=Nepenthes gracilis TaxID=150966 RepID=A0AAD3XS62_NEPGR|nr:hypothetical protein Nepgr_017453 [Nepenthes gracilis]